MRNQGFTLLEVILAAAMTAFVAATALAGFRTATDTRKAVRLANEAQDTLRFCAMQIEKDLSSVVRGRECEFEGFAADPELNLPPRLRMHIYSTQKARRSDPESDRYEVEYGLVQNEEEEKLLFVRRVCPVLGPEHPEETAGGILTVLSDSVVTFQVRYFDGSLWYDQWTDTESLPVLTEVLLAVQSTEATPDGESRPFTRTIWVHVAREGSTSQSALDAAEEAQQEEPSEAEAQP